jgi:RHS repeat-associated protein
VYGTGYNAVPTDRLFAGQIRDLNDDRFSFFRARYYDATIGKFVQPDTVVPNPKNSQSLNRYAYANNSPLRYVDLSGHYAFSMWPIGPSITTLTFGALSEIDALNPRHVIDQ